jgi:glycosyltransferase involved in cell wall biosynthesis
VPCFNEEQRWSTAYWEDMIATVDAEFIFVDDGSTDGTRSLLSRVSEQPTVTAVFLSANVGKGEAVRAGMRFGLDNFPRHDVAFLDADGAFSIGDVQRFVTLWSGRSGALADVDSLWSSRVALSGREILRTRRRHYVGRVIATIITAGMPLPPYDTQSGFKIFSSSGDALRRCVAEPFSTRWFFDVELIQRWEDISGGPMRIWEEPLTYWKDVHGSKIRLRTAPTIVVEVLRVFSTNVKRRRVP